MTEEWLAETCKTAKCNGRRVNVGFLVSDEDWERVVGEGTVWCLTCFDEEAQRKGVDYEILETCAVTWADKTLLGRP